MPISLVAGGAVDGSAGNGANVTLTLPTLQQNDVVYVFYGNANATHSVSGWTQVGSTTNQGIYYVSLWRKVMASTPDTSAVCSGGGNADHGTAAVGYCLRGVDTSTPEDVTPVITQGTGQVIPDPGAITPTTSGAWVVVFGSNNYSDPAVTVPSGYSNGTNKNANDAEDSTVAVASKSWTSGEENPAAWTGWSSVAASDWVAITVAVRPAADVAAVKDIIQSSGFIAFAR